MSEIKNYNIVTQKQIKSVGDERKLLFMKNSKHILRQEKEKTGIKQELEEKLLKRF
jgi:esterase/lipase